MQSESTEEIQKRSAQARTFVSVLWVLCALLIVLERFSNATIQADRP